MTKTDLTIGFARLSDCAVLAAAEARGNFAKYGLNVTLKRFDSWAAMRDALGHRTIDAAHMLAPMVVASAAGLGPYPGAFTTSFAFNLNGNAITVSTALYEQMCTAAPDTMHRRPLSAAALKRLVIQRQEAGAAPLVFAYVYPYSMHAYELRYWLGAAGIDPHRDVQLIVIPPNQMVDSLAAGLIDGYCVGEPWNNAAVVAGHGRTLITSGEIWSNSPEKVLAVRNDWAQDNPDTHLTLLKALLESAAWVDQPANRVTAAQIVSGPSYIDAPFDEVVGSLTGRNRQTGGETRADMPDFNVFHRYAANFPWRSHAKWILSQMIRWGEAPREIDIDAVAEAAFQPQLYRSAARALSVACPTIDEKTEGTHDHAWVLMEATLPIAFGPDRFMDGRVFDPANIDAYLDGFGIRTHKPRMSDTDAVQVVRLSRPVSV